MPLRSGGTSTGPLPTTRISPPYEAGPVAPSIPPVQEAETDEDEVRLLRLFEPVVRLNEGEYFVPISVESYVRHAALWHEQDGQATVMATAASFDLSTLPEVCGATAGVGQSLSGIRLSAEDDGTARIPARKRPPRIRGVSRLAAVGLIGRLVDSLNRLSLVFRGSVPSGSAARSYLLQQTELDPDRPTYHGRVVRDGPWLVCQYWYFYAFNNWRSAFGGVNDHEGDWEQVTVFLDGTGGETAGWLPTPRWVVFSAHDEVGDDLRRRWDDPDLTLVDGCHPVVFAGAGSHSGAYLSGDYLITVEPPKLGGLVAVLRWLARVLTPWSSHHEAGVGIPYLDYARGDGRVIGAGGEPWDAVVIDDSTPWVGGYRGLWGLDTGDRLGGERGPAGPRYERDGTVRPSWADPVGWAGLAKVAPNPAVEREYVQARVAQIDGRLKELDDSIATVRRDLGLAAAGLVPRAPEVRALAPEERRVIAMMLERATLADERLRLMAPRAASVESDDPHAHLSHRSLPLVPATGLRSRLLSWWAVLSTPLLLYALAAVIHPSVGVTATATAVVWIVLLLGIEAIVRHRFLAYLWRVLLVTLLLAALGTFWQEWRVLLSWAVVAAGLVVLALSIRDAMRR